VKSGVFLVAFCARLKTYGALFGDKNHKAFSRFCLCGHEKSGLAVMEKGAEISRIIDETGIGWNCPPNDPVALARLIDEICELDLSSLGGVPRSVLQQNYSEYISLEKFAACVRPLLSESKI
ncbi:hypothetical protein JTM47_34390, partial [Pseudomonas aeruginosa]|nr:hypothetical protein [Pseudomonas aeruginosa]